VEDIVRGDSCRWHQQKSFQRIVAKREGRVQPIFDSPPLGCPSPSSSLLVERYDLAETDWQTHELADQVLTLFLKPAKLQRRLKDVAVSEIPLAAGHVSFSVREEWESARWNEKISILCVRIPDSALRNAAREYMPHERLEIVPKPQVTDARLTRLMKALEAERLRGYASGRLFLDGIEAAMAAVLVSGYSAVSPKPITTNGGLPPHRLRRVLEFIHANIDRPLTLEDLASCVGLSTSHFSHQFRASTGTTPYQYVLRDRAVQETARKSENVRP
jgi:AraC family transcriptional regulator